MTGRELASRTHGSATTTPSVREAIQASEEKNTVLAKRYGVDRKTIAKWKARKFSSDVPMGPKNPRSKFLTLDDEVIILAYRWRTRLSLDNSLVRLRRLMPQLSRSALYRCLERHGLSKIGRTNVSPPLTSASLAGPYRFEITANDVALPGDVLRVPVFLAVEEVTKHAYGEVAEATPENAAAFLARLVAEFPQKIDAVTTDIRPAFAHLREAFGEDMPHGQRRTGEAVSASLSASARERSGEASGAKPAHLVRRSHDRALEKIANSVPQDPVRWQPDRILDPLGFQKFVDLGIGKAGVSSETDARNLSLISRHDGLEHGIPCVGAVNVAGTQSAAFQITELIEHEQRVITGASVMAVPDAILLFAMRRADARIHVEHDATGRPSTVHKIDPLAGQVGKSRKVRGAASHCVSKRPIWLGEAAQP